MNINILYLLFFYLALSIFICYIFKINYLKGESNMNIKLRVAAEET